MRSSYIVPQKCDKCSHQEQNVEERHDENIHKGTLKRDIHGREPVLKLWNSVDKREISLARVACFSRLS